MELKQTVLKQGLKLNHVLPALFMLRDGRDKIIAVLTTNVDDLLYGYLPEGETAVKNILERFKVGKEESASFRFCGKEYMSITVTAKDNIERISGIMYGDKRKLADKCNEGETGHLRQVVASLAWIARQTRPGLSYRVSRLQGRVAHATVADLRQCDRGLQYAKETSD